MSNEKKGDGLSDKIGVKIFLSYGHDKYADFVKKFKDDLEQYGFKGWIDAEDIRAAKDWQEEIEKGIDSSDWIVVMMTGHAIRRPGGVCLDEIAYARKLGKDILPIMLQEVEPPLCITRLQYVDISKHYDEAGNLNLSIYEEKLKQIIKHLNGEEEISFEGVISELKNILLPLNNDLHVSEYKRDFYGRQWLFDSYTQWLADPDSRVFVVSGQAGSGKTAIVAKMCHSFGEVWGVHFCKYNDNDRSDPKRVIMSLAYHIASQNKEYGERVVKLADLNKLREKTVTRLFSYLITEPLYGLNQNQGTKVLIIDALDEADYHSKNELIDVIVNEAGKLPKWLKLVVTTRPEKDILLRLKSLHPHIIEESKEQNEEDIRGYVKKQLCGYLTGHKMKEEIIENIVSKSEGNFLYVKDVCRGVKDGDYQLDSLDSFPAGLLNVYWAYFERINFIVEAGGMSYKDDIRPILQIIASAYEPLNTATISEILDIDEYDLDDILYNIHVLFPVKNQIIEPIHKSLFDWLVDRDISGKYAVRLSAGHRCISKYLLDKYRSKQTTDYMLKYLVKHLIAAGETDNAKTVLSDMDFTLGRIALLGLDSAMREYISEYRGLCSVDQSIVSDVYKAGVLRTLILEHDKYFYNSGHYLTLDKIGFYEHYSANIEEETIEFKAIFADYLYITERFEQAVNLSKELLGSHFAQLTGKMQAKLFDICSLSYRKLVDFDQSIHYAQILQTVGGENDYLYEKSLGLLMHGKIEAHRLNFVNSCSIIQKAIVLLTKSLSLEKQYDEQITIELFIAEYYRVLAVSALWCGDLDKAQDSLDKAVEIYERLRIKDRYYARYIYTEAFKDLICRDFSSALERLTNLESEIKSEYDRFQVSFYKAWAYIGLANTQSAAIEIERGIKHAGTIDARFEVGEMYVLKKITDKNSDIPGFIAGHQDIKTWFDYAYGFIGEKI